LPLRDLTTAHQPSEAAAPHFQTGVILTHYNVKSTIRPRSHRCQSCIFG